MDSKLGPVYVNLGKRKRGAVRQLVRGQTGNVSIEVQRAVSAALEANKTDDKEVLPLVLVFEQKRRKRRLLPGF